eukprot:6212520-Pleurochrysis_carterae.AAC.4
MASPYTSHGFTFMTSSASPERVAQEKAMSSKGDRSGLNVKKTRVHELISANRFLYKIQRAALNGKAVRK